MADLDDIYNQKIFEVAAEAPAATRLERPDATATAQSKLCGSTITVDLALSPDGRTITDFGQKVKACLLGQASAAIVGREIKGTATGEFHAIAAQMRKMLKDGGEPPNGRWADLAMLQPVKDYPHRHASTLLVFEAVERALAEREARLSSAAS